MNKIMYSLTFQQKIVLFLMLVLIPYVQIDESRRKKFILAHFEMRELRLWYRNGILT